VEQALFRLAQEALANVSKHAAAGQVEIRLAHADNAITLGIADDGCGFDPQVAADQGLGLDSMRERVEALGGELSVESAPGAGTRLVARIELE
jgi:signal transduction histidine kinase